SDQKKGHCLSLLLVFSLHHKLSTALMERGPPGPQQHTLAQSKPRYRHDPSAQCGWTSALRKEEKN
ncbi:MAG: hypothetical protein ABFS37_11865, partial [Acidobacteriota bacterium]